MSTISLNQNKFFQAMVAAGLVMAGVMLKNGGKQLSKFKGNKENNTTMMIGMALFILGWVGVAWVTSSGSLSSTRSRICVAASATILVIVIVMMEVMKKNPDKKPRWFMVLPVMFSVAWIALGYGVSMGKKNIALWLGVGASLFVILSMLISLPWQRKKNIIDGPGVGLFALAWVGISMANALS